MANVTEISRQFEFCPMLAELLGNSTAVGRSGKVFDGLGALSTVNNLLTLRQLMLENKSARTMEIGLSFGGSALVFTATLRDLGGGRHVALDPYQQAVWDDTGLIAVERAGLKEYLDFRPNFSAFELPRMIEQGEQFDLIYVDGSHLFEDVFIDAYYSSRLLKSQGIIAFDDSSDPHVNKVLGFIRANMRDSLAELDLTSYKQGRKAKFKYRIAHRLGKQQFSAFRRIGDVERAWDAPFQQF